MERCLLLFFFSVFFTLCSNAGTKENLFDRADKKKEVYVNNSKKTIILEKVDEIAYYKNTAGNITDYTPLIGSINYKDSLIYIFDKYDYTIYQFDLNSFGNNSEYVKKTIIKKGKGPNEFIDPIDMQFDNKRKLIYIADSNNYCIYVYDTQILEIKRIRLNHRPYRLFVSDKYLYVNNYAPSIIAPCISKIDLETYRIEEGLFTPSKKGNWLEQDLLNGVFIEEIDEEKGLFVATRTYPTFNLYFCNEHEILKTFCSPYLAKIKKFPKPKIVYDDGNRCQYSLVAYDDIFFAGDSGLIYTISTTGKAAYDLNIDSYISIYDLEGNTLCEQKVPPSSSETSIVIDEENDFLYYFNHKDDLLWINPLEYKAKR